MDQKLILVDLVDTLGQADLVSPEKMNLNNWFIPNPFIYSAVSSNWPYIDYPKFRKAIAFCKNTDEIMVLNSTLSLFDSEQKCKQRSAELCTLRGGLYFTTKSIRRRIYSCDLLILIQRTSVK